MSPAVAPPSFAEELASITGDAHVSIAPDQLSSLAIDGVSPAADVAPASADELAAIIALANRRGWCITPHGSGTQHGIGNIPEKIDLLLRTTRFTAVEHFDPGDLTIGLGAGATLADLDRIVGEHGQMLPLDLLENDTRTIGGLLATAVGGPMRVGYGTIRDHCIGIRFVAGDGRRVRGGGRVVKNVAGYDLMKLLIGSFGTLGVISSASFKLVPRPRQTVTFAAEFATAAEALAWHDRIAASQLSPLCREIVSPNAKRFLRAAESPVHPEDYAPAVASTRSTNWAVFIRGAGSDAVLGRLRRDLGAAVSREITGPAETALWQRVTGIDRQIVARHHNAMVLSLAVTNTQVLAALAAIEHTAADFNFVPAIIGRAGSLVAGFAPLAVDPPSAMQYANAASTLRAALPPGSVAIVVRCPLEAKRHFDVWGSPTSDLASMRAIKQKLDPNAILNRGRFLV